MFGITEAVHKHIILILCLFIAINISEKLILNKSVYLSMNGENMIPMKMEDDEDWEDEDFDEEEWDEEEGEGEGEG